MKYRTIIELVCNAPDKEEANHAAGEYLRGGIDSGIEMRSRTVALSTHRLAKYGIRTALTVLFISALLFNVIPSGSDARQTHVRSIRLSGTCTVQPGLKTSGESEFKKDWERKKEEAVLDYLKN